MKTNKKLLVRNKVGTPHFKVIYEGGGELPKDLSGLYTSKNQAEKAIQLYLIKRDGLDASSSSK